MTATTKITSGAGLRGMRIYALDSAGYPDGDQAGDAGYDGVSVSGVKSVALNVPDIPRIQHTGNDRVIAQDFLPANELPSGTVSTAKANQYLDALLTNTLVETIGESQMDAQVTDEQGNEIDIMVIYWRQALDTDPDATTTFGLRRWQTFVLPKTRMVPQMSGADQGQDDVNTYAMTPTVVKAAPWGKALSTGDNGAEQAVRLRLTGDYPNVIERFDGNNTVTEFQLAWTPISVAKTKAYVDGVAATVASVDTGASPSLTMQSAPGNAAVVVAVYETTDPVE